MSDIVEQLRAQAANVPITLALDAAVEIERLRTALQKIAYPESGEYPSDEMIVKAVVKIARAALGERQSSELIAPRREQTDEKSTFQTRTKEGQAGDAGLANFDDSVLRPEPEPGDKGRGLSDKN
jgi:hypothetical protein